ncbi:hypothetical protein HV073_07565 [Klebsiella michiganensis]|uniref:hypothetical protein n=1 Tax=Enterobacteriaceae TaxID=543 RepID=UPI0010845183|nr:MULTISPECIES: hypothetical protein [Klebsiella]EKW5906149.1 hypothetical protein [Klebsiella pneumoniae]EKZ6776136.1 hypothetical protein [Klebsiella pneumoniae]MBA8051426.1 hypothetical protein [Klebsiella michiganensis]VGD82669.1 Uncharacterised protein [Klebsiella pneumoniae]VGI02215.1 Uncharacterised protein [Klebsiella pneumoniae]
MRYIDIEALRLHDGWFGEAEAATRAIIEGNDIPGDHEEIWRGIKAKLAEVLHNKCWFCETPIPRSDNAVDHFRPKGRVSDAAKKHTGYKWLACECANFRYACTFCNSRRIDVENGTSGGKADRFPLLNEDNRVYEIDPKSVDFDDLFKTVRGEQPTLLDPCSLNDWELLGCMRENGRPCSTKSDGTSISRVKMSIEVYHLDHEPTCKQRHLAAVRLLETVRDAKDAFLKVDINDPETEVNFTKYARRIRRMIDRNSPYSGEMVFLLRGQRSPDEHPWIDHLLVS